MPAPSGAFTFLVRAALENGEAGPASGMHLLCLDEFNLAQPEHYLSNVVQAISRPEADRSLAMFDPSSLRPDDPLLHFSRLPLARNVLICGTMNDDETVRPLSARLLDRFNVVECPASRTLQALPASIPDPMPADGARVRRSDIRRWSRAGSAPPPITIDVLAEIQPILADIGCPLTPRRQQAMHAFVAGASPLVDPIVALDMQIRQRVVPQIRGLFQPGAVDRVESLAETLGRIPGLERSTELVRTMAERERAMSVDLFAPDD